MGVLFTIFTTSIVIFIIGEGIILLGDRKKRTIGWTMAILGSLGFFNFFL